MLVDRIKKAIDLVKKTGEKIILFEEDNSKGIVVMSLEDYEEMVYKADFASGKEEDPRSISSLTEDELIDKINRNIAIWKDENQNRELDSEKIIESFLGISEDLQDQEEEEDQEEDNFYYYNEEDNISYPKVTSQEQLEEEEEAQSGETEKKEEQEEIGGGKNNWEIPVNIKRNAEEVEE